MQVMSVWPFKQMILRAQLKQTPTTPAHLDSDKQGVTLGSTLSPSTAAPNSMQTASQPSSSAQPALGDSPRDLVQQKLSGGDSPAQSSPESPAESAATSVCALDQAHGLHRGQQAVENPRAAVQSGPGTQAKPAGASGDCSAPLQTDYIFHFGDTTEIRKALEMPNRLTGYAMSGEEVSWMTIGTS